MTNRTTNPSTTGGCWRRSSLVPQKAWPSWFSLSSGWRTTGSQSLTGAQQVRATLGAPGLPTAATGWGTVVGVSESSGSCCREPRRSAHFFAPAPWW
jgi:hypothetical protein